MKRITEPLHVKAERALNAAIAGAIEEHRRLDLPLVFYRNGKVIHVSAQQLKTFWRVSAKRFQSHK